MNIKDAVEEAHGNSRDHGFWDQQIDMDQFQPVVLDRKLVLPTIPEKLCLIHSEVSEALECYRDNDMEVHLQVNDWGESTGKPLGFPSELADICIRVFDLAGALGIDLEAEIVRKMEYNRSRPYKHGKVC